MISFADMDMAPWLWMVPALAAIYTFGFKRRTRDMQRFAQADLIEKITPSLRQGARLKQALAIIATALLMCLALMRPQMGFKWEEVKRTGLDILIAIDTSKSMLARDVRPNRLERTKLETKDLLKRLRGDRVGLIAFSGSAFLQSPLTTDYNGFALSLDALDAGIIPRGGTSISNAIRTGIKSFGGGLNKYKVMVLITDGEDHEGGAIEAATEAANAGIRIYTVGIGTSQGEIISLESKNGQHQYLRDNEGRVVKSRLNESILSEIAIKTGGSYVSAGASGFGLSLLYDTRLAKLEKKDITQKQIKRYTQRYQFPLALALIILCMEPFIRQRRTLT